MDLELGFYGEAELPDLGPQAELGNQHIDDKMPTVTIFSPALSVITKMDTLTQAQKSASQPVPSLSERLSSVCLQGSILHFEQRIILRFCFVVLPGISGGGDRNAGDGKSQHIQRTRHPTPKHVQNPFQHSPC